MQRDSTENDYRRPPSGYKWFYYVPIEAIPEWEDRGWKVVDFMEDLHHGHYSVLMQWMCGGEPDKPRAPKQLTELRNTTIEECARVVEARAYDHDDMVRLAAAIRALKDKP